MGTYTAGTGSSYYQNPNGNGAFGRLLTNVGWDYFVGELDDFTIWDKALTATEIRDLVCRKTPGSSSQLLGYFNFDTQVSGQVFDSSPYGHTGAFVGTVTMPNSGAAMGDTSHYYYAGAYTGFSTVLTTGQAIDVSNITSGSNGVQIYEVFSTPNSLLGLPSSALAQNYFGVFLAITDNATKSYTLRLGNFAGKQLYKRDANDDLTWSLVNPTSVVGGLATFPTEQLRQEYIIVSTAKCRTDLGSDIDTCFPANFWLKDNFYHPTKNYSWSTGSTADSILITAPGVYSVQMDSAGCVKSDTIIVSTKSIKVDLGPDINVCEPFSVWIKDLHFHPSKTYTWNGSTVADSIQISSYQQVTVVADSAGCTQGDTLLITTSSIDVDLGPDLIICSNQSDWIKDLNYSSAKTYTWGNGLVADSILISSAQTVTVMADSSGCSAFDTLVVTVESYSPPLFDSPIQKCIEEPLTYSFPVGDYSFLWPNGSTSNTTIINTQTQLTFYTISPCGDSTLHNIDVIQEVCDNPCYIFVPNVFTPNGDFTNDVFLIGVNCNITFFSIQIFNRWGNIVYESENAYFEWNGTFEDRLLAEGVYTYVIRYSGFDKIIKTKHGLIHLLE